MANIYTQDGEEAVVDLIDTDTWHIGWGTGAGTAAKGDTTLFTEAAESRVQTTDSQPSADINQFLAEITSASGQTITNAGVFDATSGGNLLLKSDFTGVVLASGDKIEFTFTLEQT